LPKGLGWMRWQLGGILRGFFGRPGTMPLDLALAQFAGCVAGPTAYVKARREDRRLQRRVIEGAAR
jgi:hypothetical protein